MRRMRRRRRSRSRRRRIRERKKNSTFGFDLFSRRAPKTARRARPPAASGLPSHALLRTHARASTQTHSHAHAHGIALARSAHQGSTK
eukprot:6814721-Pyramimonas_sp.AAC.1